MRWLFHPSRPTVRARVLAATVVTLIPLAVLSLQHARFPGMLYDVDQSVAAARFLLGGENPYDLIGPDRPWPLPFPFLYPVTAAVAVTPLARMDPLIGRAVFVILPTFLLAFALTRDGFHRLPLFASAAYLVNAKMGQWSVWMAVAMMYPWVGFALSAKPNLGVAAVAGMRGWRDVTVAAVGAGALTLLTVILWPWWVGEWMAVIRDAPHIQPAVMLPGGFLLLSAALRYRDPRARLLLALALVPQTGALVPAFLAMLIPQSFKAVAVLALLSYVPYFLIAAPSEFDTFAAYARREATLTLWAVYLPALAMVLLSRHYGPVPATGTGSPSRVSTPPDTR